MQVFLQQLIDSLLEVMVYNSRAGAYELEV